MLHQPANGNFFTPDMQLLAHPGDLNAINSLTLYSLGMGTRLLKGNNAL
jgi:hypothetical protein